MSAVEEKMSSNKTNLAACSSNDDVSEQANEECNSVSGVSSAVTVIDTEKAREAQENVSSTPTEDSQSKINTRTRLTRRALQTQRSSSVKVPLSEIRNCVVLCKKLEINLRCPRTSTLSSVSQYNLNQCRQLTIKLRRLSGSSFLRKQPHKGRNRRNIFTITEEDSGSPGAAKSKETLVENGKSTQTLSEEGNKFEEDTETAFNERIMCKHGKFLSQLFKTFVF